MRYIFAFILLIALSMGVAGCSFDTNSRNTTPVVSQVPVLEAPARPTLEVMTPAEVVEYMKLADGTRAKLESNDKKLKVYAEEMAVEIKAYNLYATAHNRQSNTWLGIKPPAEKEK